MSRLRIAAIAIAFAALGIAPATAQATVTSSQITSWVSRTTDGQGHTSTITNGAYLMSLDNPPGSTTLTVKGTAVHDNVNDRVDIACFYGSSSNSVKLVDVVPLSYPLTGAPNGTFNTGPILLRSISGHACRLRAVGASTEGPATDVPAFAGPQVAVSEAALPSATFGGKPFDFYVNAITFTGNATWTSAGSPTGGCGPSVAPLGPAFDISGNFAINCMGSLQGSDLPLPSPGHRSEVRVDGQNAYDAASAHALLGNGADPQNFPSLSANVDADPTSGLVSSDSTEDWVVCPGLASYPPNSTNCQHFASAGIQLERRIVTSDGGEVITMTDTWSSTDGRPHSLDLLYDDSVGETKFATQRGYEFPGQTSFSAYGAGASVAPPSAAPGSILVRSNLAAADGATSEAVGAITFSSPPSGFTFVNNGEFEEQRIIQVPATRGTSLTYIYSTAYTVADATRRALAAQDYFQPVSLAIASPSGGATMSTPSVNLAGTATAGSGITALSVGGQSVPVGPGGAWSATIPLGAGTNTITAVAVDAAGAAARAQVTVVYQPPPPPPPPLTCKVPRLKDMKLAKAERALRRAHCRVGKVKRVRSGKIGRGRVMSTTPRAGRRLPAGAKVELFVSRGS